MWCYWYPIPTGYLINVEWAIGNDAEDKRGCQGVQIIKGKPVNGHLGGGGGGRLLSKFGRTIPTTIYMYLSQCC